MASGADECAAPLAAHVSLFGQPVVIEVDDHELHARLSWLLGDLRSSPRNARRLRLVSSSDGLTLLDGREVVRSGMASDLGVAMALWRLNQLATSSPVHAVVHAGCVATQDMGLVLVGPSGAGKSTLVAALVRQGLPYLSDELVGLSVADGLLWPHATPIGLRPGAQALLAPLPIGPLDLDGRRAVRPIELGGSTCGPVRPGAIVILAPRRGRRPRLSLLRPSTAVAELANHALNLEQRPKVVLGALARLAAATPAWRLVAGDIDSTCHTLRALLEPR